MAIIMSRTSRRCARATAGRDAHHELGVRHIRSLTTRRTSRLPRERATAAHNRRTPGEGRMNSVRMAVLGAVMTVVAAGAASAQATPGAKHERRDLRQDRRELATDKKEVR